MTYAEQMQAAPNPKDALLVIAAALDEIRLLVEHREQSTEDWFNESWVATDERAAEIIAHHTAKITEDGDTTTVEIPPPSDEKFARRLMFAQQSLKLDEQLPDRSLDEMSWAATYAKGGPTWLYLGNRDLVMSYPPYIRQALVQDLEEDSPQQAHEMSRDILKEDCETGPGGTGMHVASGDLG